MRNRYDLTWLYDEEEEEEEEKVRKAASWIRDCS